MSSTTATDVKIQPFVLVQDKKVITGPLIPTREIGRVARHWFDEATVQQEFMKKESKESIPTRVSHPGSKIGEYFRKHRYEGKEYKSAYFMRDSVVVYKLKQRQLILDSDINKSKPEGCSEPEYLLHCYTPEQLEKYIQHEILKDFSIEGKLLPPIEIDIKEDDKKRMHLEFFNYSSRKPLF